MNDNICSVRCTQIKTYSWDNAQVILVGNKSDMEDERVISYERGKQLADSLGLQFFETSAKENINVRVGRGECFPISFSLDLKDNTLIKPIKTIEQTLKTSDGLIRREGVMFCLFRLCLRGWWT